MKAKYLIIVLLLCNATLTAQTYKIGYINVEKVFSEWPKVQSANLELQTYEIQLQSQLQTKVKNFQTQLASYNKNVADMTPDRKKSSEAALQKLQAEINKSEAEYKTSVANKNVELLTPLQEKFKNTIDSIGREKGFTHIFNLNSALIFTTDKDGDITALVAERLGFTLSD